MSQDAESGRRAARWGVQTARRLAAAIGARDFIRANSNESEWNGKRVVIKGVAAATKKIGVTCLTLKRVDLVMGAFQLDDGSFELWSLPPSRFPHACKGALAGQFGQLSKRQFRTIGRLLGRVGSGMKNFRAAD